MANKWQICLDVTLIEKETLTGLLEAEVSALQSVLELTADAGDWQTLFDQIKSLEQLQAQIKLAWIEREASSKLRTARFGPPWRVVQQRVRR